MNRAPHFLLVPCAGTDRKLALGLRWLVLIGSDASGLARARGRRLRATHVVVGGSPATVAGYGRARKAWRPGSHAGAPPRGGHPIFKPPHSFMRCDIPQAGNV